MPRFLMQTIAALAIAGTATIAIPPASTAGPDITRFVLGNGLEVVVIPDRRAPVVTHMIWYRVGSADEEQGKSGIAHFLEHLMFKGTAKNPGGKFSQVVAAIGGQENAFTGPDYTAYFQRVAREHLGTLMEFEADRMTGLVLTDANVLPEREVVLEERRSRTDNDPRAQLSEAAQAALYVNHPYGRPVIGWEHEIRQLNREDALAFYRRHYAPNNAVLVISGDIGADEVRALADKTYGKLAKQSQIKPRMRPLEPNPLAHRRVVLADARVAQPSLSRSYLVPSYRTAKPGEGEALEVLSQILGNGSTSRLYRALVVEKGIAANAGAWYQGTAIDATSFGIYASPRPGVSLDDLEKSADAVIAEVATNGVTDEELARTKTRLIADTIYSQDSQAMLARIYGATLMVGLSVDHVKTWPDRIRAVTVEEVRGAAKNYLDLRRAVTGHLIKTPAPPEKRT
ncbi:MAG TPA: pitrilysin family protein [Xanthobacteraceae bacterium]